MLEDEEEGFFFFLFLFMALEAFTLDRGALPLYEEHIQIDWREEKGWHQQSWLFIVRE